MCEQAVLEQYGNLLDVQGQPKTLSALLSWLSGRYGMADGPIGSPYTMYADLTRFPDDEGLTLWRVDRRCAVSQVGIVLGGQRLSVPTEIGEMFYITGPLWNEPPSAFLPGLEGGGYDTGGKNVYWLPWLCC
jgi:hypothetical protein